MIQDDFETEEHYVARGEMINIIFKVLGHHLIVVPDGIQFKLYLYSILKAPDRLTIKTLFTRKH